MSRTLTFLVFAAAIGSGVVGGILFVFSTSIMPAFGRLSSGAGAEAMNAINVAVMNPAFMGVFLGTALLCAWLGIGVVTSWAAAPQSRLILVGCVAYLVGTIGTTMAFNVALNDQLATTPAAQVDQFWADYLRVWTNWNHVRTIAAIAAAMLFTGALARA